MGIYEHRTMRDRKVHESGVETWIEEVRVPGLLRQRVVTGGAWIETRTDCFCCSCGSYGAATLDPYCRNHGWAARRPCDTHVMPGEPDDGGVMPVSVQDERERHCECERRYQHGSLR